MMRKLSQREADFVAAYLPTFNGKQAAIAAGYSEKSATAQASRLLTRANVRAELQRHQERLAHKHAVTLDKVIGELAKIGFANMGDYMDVGADGLPRLNWVRLTKDQKAAIAEVTVDIVGEEVVIPEGGTPDGEEEIAVPIKRVKFKLHDKRAALVDLGKHLGLFDGHRDPDAPAGTTIINNDNRTLILSGMPADELARQYREALAAPAALLEGPKAPRAGD
jgi:phage terminase small subunit